MNYHSGFGDYQAILVGVSRYHHAALPSVPAARNSIRAVQDVLRDPALCGWPPERITVISDPESVSELGEQVTEMARQTTGLFLLYYVGHGLLDDAGALYLTVASTNPDNLRYSGVPWSHLSGDLRGCPAEMRFAVLDCCFSGRAIEVLGGGTESRLISDITNIQGVYTLTATTRNQVAHVPPPGQQAEAATSFTGELCDLIRTGIPARPMWLTFGDLYPTLSDRIRARGLPAPYQRGTGTVLEHALTRNAALPPDLASDECIAAVINARKAGLAVVRALLQAITIGMTAAALNAKTRNLAREPADEPDDSGRPASMLLRAGGAAFGLFRSAASESAVAKLARDRDRALADARDHTVDLVHALGQTIELDPQRSGFLASASAFTLELAKRLSGADFRDLADAGVRAVASSSSDELIKMVIGLHMDVSGRDLSSLSGTEQDNLNALYGVTWNEATIWPPAWAGSVHQWSHEVRPGVHRIYRSSVRNLAASVLEATRATEVGH